MAIIRDIPGVKVSIESKGGPLKEYDDDDESDSNWKLKDVTSSKRRRISKYIECESDAEFNIKLEITRAFDLAEKTGQYDSITFLALVDGNPVARHYPRYKEIQPRGWSGFIDGSYMRVSPTEVSYRPLKFCSITRVESTDTTRVKHDMKRVAGLGEIVLLLHRTRHYSPPRHEAFLSNELPKTITEVAEKALKGQALSHGTAFGPEQRRYSKRTTEVKYPDGAENPLGVFRFKYRSHEALQAECIIPRSPSPGEDSTAKRIANLKREIARIKEEEEVTLVGARRRPADDDGSQIPRSGKRYKTTRGEDGQTVVDLTED